MLGKSSAKLCVLVPQPDRSSGSAMLAAWGVEGLEKVLVLGSSQDRNAPLDDIGTCDCKLEIPPQNH